MKSSTIRSDAELLADIATDRDEPSGPAADAAPLREISAAVSRRSRAEADIAEAVIRARKAKLSWSAIGAALGITRQGALKRYGTRLSDSG